MKTAITAILLLVVSFTHAQTPIELTIPQFNTIKVYDLMTVNLVKSTENKIIITGRDAQDVEYVLKNDLLKVRMKTDKIFDGGNTFVHVYYTNIDVIDGNEGAVITSNEMIEQPQLSIMVQEGARVKAGLKIDNLKLRAVSGGIIEASGTATYQEVVVNTGGIIENHKLVTDYTTVKVQAGGEVEVHATKSVDVNVRAGGDVIVTGSPEKVSKKTLFGGSISIK
ncbi:MAG: DUF2807 domain-containing protein [Nonlabens sp.]|nr:DUF2807 domain-containing protein [Nonlabens sp.]MDP5101292.1 DUF2807 domain-containing protein [Nonlabens sp.]